MADPSSTLVDLEEVESAGARWGRRLWLLAMAVLVGVAAAGLSGTRTATVTRSSGGYRLTVAYPAVSRAGLDVPWQVTVRRPGGFGKGVDLAVTGDYFQDFEAQGLWPEPDTQTRDGRDLYWHFTAPPGDTFVVDFDAYVQPAAQTGRSARVSVLVDGRPVVSVDYVTRLVP